jgi:hypothetical protein
MKTLISTLILCWICLGTALGSTTVSGALAVDDTWTASGSPYTLDGDFTIPASVTLTIEPGVEVFLNSRSYDIFVDGTLNASGNSGNEILFKGTTSFGGGSIVIDSGAVSTFNHCVFDSLGVSVLSAYDCAIRAEDGSTLFLSESEFIDNTTDIIADADVLGNISGTNNLEKIQILANSLSGSAFWPSADDDGFNYKLGGDITVAAGDTLTIGDRAQIEFASRNYDIIVNGHLEAVASSVEDSIRFFGASSAGSIYLPDGGSANLEYCMLQNMGVEILSAYD